MHSRKRGILDTLSRPVAFIEQSLVQRDAYSTHNPNRQPYLPQLDDELTIDLASSYAYVRQKLVVQPARKRDLYPEPRDYPAYRPRKITHSPDVLRIMNDPADQSLEARLVRSFAAFDEKWMLISPAGHGSQGQVWFCLERSVLHTTLDMKFFPLDFDSHYEETGHRRKKVRIPYSQGDDEESDDEESDDEAEDDAKYAQSVAVAEFLRSRLHVVKFIQPPRPDAKEGTRAGRTACKELQTLNEYIGHAISLEPQDDDLAEGQLSQGPAQFAVRLVRPST